MQPIRPMVYALTEFDKDASEMTLRDCLEWYKTVIKGMDSINELEAKYLNQRWAALCEAVGAREGVPTGSLSYYLGELAQAEVSLAETGEQEARDAGVE